MKFTAVLPSIGLAILGSFLFLSGVGGLWIDYAPSVDAETIAVARDRAYAFLFTGVVVLLSSAVACGLAARIAPKAAAISAVILAGSSLYPLAFWLFA